MNKQTLFEKRASQAEDAINKYFHIHNRKYLGSKTKLLPFIKEVILGDVKKIETFVDGFAGTGVVGNHFAPYSERVIANDLLYSNYVILNTFLNLSRNSVSIEKIKELIAELNALEGYQGYVYTNFSGTYFTEENATLIDAIREKIEYFYETGKCTYPEKLVLLTSLLFAIDKVANTVGHYDAFLKNLGNNSYSESGKHMVDSNVYKRITLGIPAFNYYDRNEVYCEDINNLVQRIEGDVIYLDPPYNNRQYIDCYHLLENIALWQKPAVYGKTSKFERDHLKSDFSRKRKSSEAFRTLIENIKANHIFLSYNNEGIIPDETIMQIIESKGKVKIHEQPYSIFGNGAGKSSKRKITERIFYCRVF